uniref:Uncharacterized protein n=1 Tax=viral metagenome TaxID=1070528 RepID=A0A6C0DP04_9ZZZZ
MSIVLPVAMLGATVLGGIGIYVGLIDTEEKGSIKLSSGQRIYVGSEVRLNQNKKDGYPNSCLQKVGNGRVTEINESKRTVKFACRKGGKVEIEELPADVLDIVSSGINAVGISISGGYLTEGSRVRLLQSARVKNRGKGLASPFANSVGMVTHINPKRKTEVMVRTERLDNSKGSFEEVYQVEDLEFVSGPSEPGKRGIKGGLIGIGTTVQLKRGADGKIDPEVLKKHANPIFGKASEAYRLTGEKHNDAMGILREWETFGTVTRVLADPKTSKDFATVRCVSKDAVKSVVEEDYELEDLEAVPARSIPRPGIPIFGGMANNDVKVRLRAERKEAVASKPLGRPAFGDEGTVVDIQPEDKDNLQILVVCNGKNPEELTKEWYEPEDLEIAEPDDTEGEAVFGGRVTVGSMVRVRQSARGKKCLGTMEVGDVGAVKGIDPNGADNMKINVTCGRSMNAKKSEWYDPRDLELFFATEEAGTPLSQAQSKLLEAQRKLNDAKSRRITNPNTESIKAETEAEAEVKAAQAKVDELTGQSVDTTKATEVFKNTKEKLESSLKLKRDVEAMRLKASKETTCQQNPGRADAYLTEARNIVYGWYSSMNIPEPIFTGLNPIQGSEKFKSAWRTVYDHFSNLSNTDGPTEVAFKKVLKAQAALKSFLELSDPTSEGNFIGLDDALRVLSQAKVAYEAIPTSPYKSDLDTLDRDVRKLEEIASDILANAFSGDTATEKLLKRINTLKTDTDKKFKDATKELQDLTNTYFEKFKAEAVAQHAYRMTKESYEAAFRKGVGQTGPVGSDAKTLLGNSITELKNYLTAKMDTVTARKKEAIKSSEVACLLISQETIEEMQKKVENAVKDKCNILGTADTVIENIDTLVEKRQRAFLASRIAIDPTMADPENAEFENSVGGDYAGRIDSINAALDALNNNPTIANLQKLVDLCGKYTGDTILKEVEDFMNAGGEPMSGGVVTPEEQARATAQAQALQYASTNVTPQGRPIANPLPTIRPYKAKNPLIGPNAPVPPVPPGSKPLRIPPATTGRTTPKLKRALNSKVLKSLDAYNPKNPQTFPTEPEELPVSLLPKLEDAPDKNPFLPTQSQRFAELIRKDNELPPEPITKLKRQGKTKSILTEKQIKKVKELGEKLAKDQILRLKSRTSGRNVILQLAQDVTAEADKLLQPILDERTDLQFKLSNLNNVDVKVGGAVDIYETEMAKVKTCMATRKASAIEQYDKELEELQKQKKEIMTTKTFEVQKQQQGQPGNKDWSQRPIEEIKREISSVNARLATPGISQSDREGKMKFLARLQGALASKQAKTGGQRHRFTMRQPRRFHGY